MEIKVTQGGMTAHGRPERSPLPAAPAPKPVSPTQPRPATAALVSDPARESVFLARALDPVLPPERVLKPYGVPMLPADPPPDKAAPELLLTKIPRG